MTGTLAEVDFSEDYVMSTFFALTGNYIPVRPRTKFISRKKNPAIFYFIIWYSKGLLKYSANVNIAFHCVCAKLPFIPQFFISS